MSSFHLQFLLSITIILLGYLLKRSNIVKESDGEAIARIVFNVTLPSVIIVTFSNVEFDIHLLWLVIIGLVFGLLNWLIAFIVFRDKSTRTKGTLMMMVPGLNIGLFAYPLVEGIWGFEGLKYFGMLDVGNAFIVFGLTFLIAAYYAGGKGTVEIRTIFFRVFRSVPLIAYFLMFSIRVIDFSLPEFMIDTASVISAANMPLSLLLLGIYLNFSMRKEHLQQIMAFLLTKYGIGITLSILCFFLIPIDGLFLYTLVIGFILPTPTSVVPYAVIFKYDKRLIGTASNLTILISFVLIWLTTTFLL